jgi:hypothetical protein
MYELEIVCLTKAIGSNKAYDHYDKKRIIKWDIKEVKEYLHKTYNKNKRTKMYIDTKDKDSVHVGFVYGYKVDKYFYQDWVAIYRLEIPTEKELRSMVK